MNLKNLKKILFKNYEKVILIFVLIGFTVSLVWLIDILYFINMQKMKTTITIKNYPYKRIDINEYTQISPYNSTIKWQKPRKRNTDKESKSFLRAYTHFLFPFKAARSRAPGANKQLIPFSYYEKVGKCPITNKEIGIVKESEIEKKTTNLDLDNDGIPNKIEKKYGLNPNDPQDIFYDKDKDSFTNISEFQYDKKGINNPSIHPPLIRRITLKKIEKTKLPLRIKNIMKVGDNKRNWTIHLKTFPEESNSELLFLNIGDTLKLNEREYTIINIDEEVIEKLNPKINDIVTKDVSTVVMKNPAGDIIAAKKNQEIYEPSKKIIVHDEYKDKNISLREGHYLKLGKKRTGIEKYKLTTINENRKSLTFTKGSKEFNITTQTDYKKPKKAE